MLILLVLSGSAVMFAFAVGVAVWRSQRVAYDVSTQFRYTVKTAVYRLILIVYTVKCCISFKNLLSRHCIMYSRKFVELV